MSSATGMFFVGATAMLVVMKPEVGTTLLKSTTDGLTAVSAVLTTDARQQPPVDHIVVPDKIAATATRITIPSSGQQVSDDDSFDEDDDE